MKRDDRLRPLSVDHHHGLVLARRTRLAAAGEEKLRAEAWAHVVSVFATELEPHFVAEEQAMFPPLAAAGGGDEVQRVREEHATLRGYVASEPTDLCAALLAFGTLLEAHIRYEERTLFPLAESLLSDAELAKIFEISDGATSR